MKKVLLFGNGFEIYLKNLFEIEENFFNFQDFLFNILDGIGSWTRSSVDEEYRKILIENNYQLENTVFSFFQKYKNDFDEAHKKRNISNYFSEWVSSEHLSYRKKLNYINEVPHPSTITFGGEAYNIKDKYSILEKVYSLTKKIIEQGKQESWSRSGIPDYYKTRDPKVSPEHESLLSEKEEIWNTYKIDDFFKVMDKMNRYLFWFINHDYFITTNYFNPRELFSELLLQRSIISSNHPEFIEDHEATKQLKRCLKEVETNNIFLNRIPAGDKESNNIFYCNSVFLGLGVSTGEYFYEGVNSELKKENLLTVESHSSSAILYKSNFENFKKFVGRIDKETKRERDWPYIQIEEKFELEIFGFNPENDYHFIEVLSKMKNLKGVTYWKHKSTDKDENHSMDKSIEKMEDIFISSGKDVEIKCTNSEFMTEEFLKGINFKKIET